MRVRFVVFTSLFLILVLLGTTVHVNAAATSTSDIQAQINAHNQKINDLQKEIASYQKQLDVTTAQKQSLQTTIKSIDVTKQKTAAQISVTQNKISAADLTIDKLGNQILSTQQTIDLDRQTIAASLREINRTDDSSPLAAIFTSDSLMSAWETVDQQAMLTQALQDKTQQLSGDKEQLQGQQQEVSSTKDQLTQLSSTLNEQKGQLEATEKSKQQLLTETKSQESAYQKLIAQKKAEQQQFQSEIFQLASQLPKVNSSQIPTSGKGILNWPLDKITITQMFGKTVDAARLYTSGSHDGVDFAASIGTPVHAALDGTVVQINQGAVQNCQYGKWVLVKHPNGLSTLYAHLSQIGVSAGQTVTTGQTLGYSGMTGYATGPHLHFTVYVSSSVTFKNYTCKAGPTVLIPIAPPSGYLDPLRYL